MEHVLVHTRKDYLWIHVDKLLFDKGCSNAQFSSKNDEISRTCYTEKKIMVVTTKSHCKSVVISGTLLYSWNYYNQKVKSAIIIFYYIFLVDIAIKNSRPLIVTNTIYFSQWMFVKVKYLCATHIAPLYWRNILKLFH